MTRVIPLETVRNQLDSFIADIQTHGTSIIIQQKDHPVAVLLSENEYASLKKLEKQNAVDDLAILLDGVHAQNTHIPEEKAAEDVLTEYHEGR